MQKAGERENDAGFLKVIAVHVASQTITSAIQRINGASLKEHWAAHRNQVVQTATSAASTRYRT